MWRALLGQPATAKTDDTAQAQRVVTLSLDATEGVGYR